MSHCNNFTFTIACTYSNNVIGSHVATISFLPSNICQFRKDPEHSDLLPNCRQQLWLPFSLSQHTF